MLSIIPQSAKNKRYLINFPVAENAHVNGILYTSTVPAKIALDLQKKAVEIAKQIAESLDINGILAVEFFITQQDTLLVNETYKILIIKKYNAKKLCKKINRNLGVIYIKKVFAQQKILGFLRLICLLLWH